MEEDKPKKSLTSSSSRSSFKTKNPLSRFRDQDNNNNNKNMTGLSMKKSWSTDSLSLLNNSNQSGKAICLCAPTKHKGSFRCRLHRSSATSHGGAATTQHHLPKPSLRLHDDQ